MVKSRSVTVLTVIMNIGLMRPYSSSASQSTIAAQVPPKSSAEDSRREVFYDQSLTEDEPHTLSGDQLAEETARWYLKLLRKGALGEKERGELVPQDLIDRTDYGGRLVSESLKKRFSEFLGGRRKRFSEFLGGKKRFSEFMSGKKRFSEFLGGKKRFSEFLGGK